jgi:GMP synthase-like glutamine amidotransferase
LLIIDPSVVFPEEEGTRVILGDWAHGTTVLRPALDNSPLGQEVLDSCTGLVVMGSAASVHDSLPWLHELSKLVLPIIRGDRRIPLLGICFGHQLIGHMAGAKVDFVHSDHAKESGFRATQFTNSKLVKGTRKVAVVVSHKEQLAELPRGYCVTAERQNVPYDAIEHKELPIFGVQFHPEARHDFTSRRAMDLSKLSNDYTGPMDELLAGFRNFALGILE